MRYVVTFVEQRGAGQVVTGDGDTLGAACLDALPRLERAGLARSWTCEAEQVEDRRGVVASLPLRQSEAVALALEERRQVSAAAVREGTERAQARARRIETPAGSIGVGDLVTYRTFANRSRRCRVEGVLQDVKNGKPGFTGTTVTPGEEPAGCPVWGYARDVEKVERDDGSWGVAASVVAPARRG